MTTKTRTCPKCLTEQPATQFQAARRSWCRSCVHEDRAAHGWGPTPETLPCSHPRERTTSPEQRRAHDSISTAVRRGDIPWIGDQTCSHCGATAEIYHHASYAPEDHLKVEPLCSSCHTKHHLSERKASSSEPAGR